MYLPLVSVFAWVYLHQAVLEMAPVFSVGCKIKELLTKNLDGKKNDNSFHSKRPLSPCSDSPFLRFTVAVILMLL